MKTSLHHFSTRRLASWQGECEFLQRSLVCAPDARQAWLWKLRLRVLEFVIARYGVDPAVRARDHAPEPGETGADLTFGERRTIEPRPRAALAAHLQGIAEANDCPLPPVPRGGFLQRWHDDYRRQWNASVRFIGGGLFGVIAGTGYAIMMKVEGREMLMTQGLGWVAGGTLAMLLGGPFSALVARLLTRK